MEKARAMIFNSEIDKKMWGEAVYTAAYLYNRSPSKTTDKTLIENWTEKNQI